MLETTTEPASLPTAGGEGRPLQEACKLAIFSTSTFAWPVVRYVLPENSNDTLRGLLCRRHRTSSTRRNSVGGVPGSVPSSRAPRPQGLFVDSFPPNYWSIRGGARPLAFYHLVHDKIHRCFPFAVGRGKEKWTKALACTRSRVGRAFLFRRSTLLLFSNRWWTEDKRGEREREIEREKARGEESGAPPSNPLLDSSPALDCSIATTRGMLSTTATKCAEEIPMLSSPLTPSPLAPSPPTDGPALFTRCTRGSLAFAAITTDHHFSMD